MKNVQMSTIPVHTNKEKSIRNYTMVHEFGMEGIVFIFLHYKR